jgi:hypothetical protein
MHLNIEFERFIDVCGKIIINLEVIPDKSKKDYSDTEIQQIYSSFHHRIIRVSSLWEDECDSLYSDMNHAKYHIKQLLLIEGKTEVLIYSKSQLKKLITRVDYLRDTFNLDELRDKKNYVWFFELFNFLNEFLVLLEELLPSKNVQSDTNIEKPNTDHGVYDVNLSTIEYFLHPFKDINIKEDDYKTLVDALNEYFQTGLFPKLNKVIQIKGRPNKKRLGWAINRIFAEMSKGIEKDLLIFAKSYISVFTKTDFDKTNYQKTNLYKDFTTNLK